MDPSKFVTPEAVYQYGPLTIVFVVVLGLLLHWYFKRYPDERAAQQNRDQLLFEQIALSRQALQTSNLVITQNSELHKETVHSNTRVGERLECVEDVLARHDSRAEKIAIETSKAAANTEAIRVKLGA